MTTTGPAISRPPGTDHLDASEVLCDVLRTEWHPVAIAGELTAREPRRLVLLGHELVGFRDQQGVAVVLDGRCPHRGTLLALGEVIAGEIACPYHGWRFDAGGRCTVVPSMTTPPPAGCHTDAPQVTERDGLVWVRLATGPPTGPPPYPLGRPAGEGARHLVGEPVEWATSAGRVLENMLDLAHFPFVHRTTFGNAQAQVVAPHDVVVRRDGGLTCEVEVTTSNPATPDGAMYRDHPPSKQLRYRYEVSLPYVLTLHFGFPDGTCRALHEVIAPTSATRCRVYWGLTVDEALGSTDEQELSFALSVFGEDQPVIESQPPGVPLHPRAEVHVPADKLAVAYRRAMRDRGYPPEGTV